MNMQLEVNFFLEVIVFSDSFPLLPISLFRVLTWMNDYMMEKRFSNPVHIEPILAQCYGYVISKI